jgi:hypothetical protein
MFTGANPPSRLLSSVPSRIVCYNIDAMTNSHNPGTAAVLSLIIPGVGQFYNGTREP